MNWFKRAQRSLATLKHMRYGEPNRDDLETMLTPTPLFGVDRHKVAIPPPPENDSDETRRELEEIQRIRKEATPCARKDAVGIHDDMMQSFLAHCKEHKLDCDEKDLKAIKNQVAAFAMTKKYHFNRPRPYQVAAKYGEHFEYDDLDSAKTPAYPSGHTTQSYVLAFYLCEKFPDHCKAFKKIAEEISMSRIIAGVHYPSDCKAGIILAEELWSVFRGPK